MTVLACEAVAGDGRPHIIVESVKKFTDSVVLAGSAVVWEGTLHLEFADGHVTAVQASRAAPERGSWETELSRAQFAELAEIHPMFDQETPPFHRRAQTLSWRMTAARCNVCSDALRSR